MLLLFDPTRGVDIGTKHEIYLLVRELADAGKAVLLYSSEVSEIVNLCDRTIVLYRGRLASELSGEKLTEENILLSALGGSETRLHREHSLPRGDSRWNWRRWVARQHGLLVAISAFLAIFVCVRLVSSDRFLTSN